MLPAPDSACSTGPSLQRYQWFVRLCLAAIALVVLPTAMLQGPVLVSRGFSNAHGGVLALVYLPLSFALWQAAQVFLCLSGRALVTSRLKGVVGLNAAYVLAAVAAVSLLFAFPAR